MINIFKKNKNLKFRDPGEERISNEPSFSKVAARDDIGTSNGHAVETPKIATRLTDVPPEMLEPVMSGVRAAKKGGASREAKSGNGTDSAPCGPQVAAPGAKARGDSGDDRDVGAPAPRMVAPKKPAPATISVAPLAKPAVGSDDGLPQFRAPRIDRTVRAPRPGGHLDGDSKAKLWEAFTPTKPKRWSRYFAGRRWAIQRVITAIEEEQAHVVIFGARGIGKTSLANVLAESASQVEYQVLRCPCSADITFDEIFRGFLRNLPSEFMDRSARAKNPTVEHFEQLLPRTTFGPTELTVALSYLKLEHVILIVDEFDRINSEHLKNQLAETIKNLSDIAARITFIVVGIAQNLDELIGKHPSIQRHLVAVHLPLMEPQELQALIQVGEEASGVSFDDATRDSIVSFAKGLPYYAQLMCLYSGRHALDRESALVEMTDLREAMVQVLDEADPVTAAMYDMATRGDRKQFMTDVMFAAARCRFDRFGDFTAADAAEVVLDSDDRKLRELTLHKALSSLCLPQNGAVLLKRRTPNGTTKYSFQHQTMRQYILVRQARQRGLI